MRLEREELKRIGYLPKINYRKTFKESYVKMDTAIVRHPWKQRYRFLKSSFIGSKVELDCQNSLIESVRITDSSIDLSATYSQIDRLIMRGTVSTLSFGYSDVRASRFYECVTSDMRANGARFTNVKFVKCDAIATIMHKARFWEVEFRDSCYWYSEFRKATFDKCVFGNSDFHVSDFRYAEFTDCDFTGANLANCDFRSAKFFNCDFTNAVLDQSDFTDATFAGCKAIDTASFRGAKNSPNGDGNIEAYKSFLERRYGYKRGENGAMIGYVGSSKELQRKANYTYRTGQNPEYLAGLTDMGTSIEGIRHGVASPIMGSYGACLQLLQTLGDKYNCDNAMMLEIEFKPEDTRIGHYTPYTSVISNQWRVLRVLTPIEFIEEMHTDGISDKDGFPTNIPSNCVVSHNRQWFIEHGGIKE